MLIGGIQTLTLLDYPGKVAALLFTAGCNMRCGYCHNAHLVLPEEIKKWQDSFIPEEHFFRFLESRKGLLDGVVITGGEPTIHPDLPAFLRRIKEMEFLVKLDTNGTNPAVVASLLEERLVDYIAMDVKASESKYKDLTKMRESFDRIKESRDLIMNVGIPYEFRTTVVKGYHDMEELRRIAEFCGGAEKYTLQNFRPQKTLDPAFGKYSGFTAEEFNTMKEQAEEFIENVEVLA